MTAYTAVPVIPVRDLDAAIAFYVDVLGFTENFRYGTYGGLLLGEVKIHLWSEGARKSPGSGEVYFLCDEVDEYYRQIVANGARPLSEPKSYPYGMRDFDLEDPDGNHLSFGAEVKE